MEDTRYVEEMCSLFGCDEVGDVDNKRGFREDVDFVRWVGASVARICEKCLGAPLSIDMRYENETCENGGQSE